MIIVTKTYTRLAVNVPFFVGNKATVDQHVSAQYQSAQPKILSRTRQISSDLTTLTTKMTFINAAAESEYENDSVVQAYLTALQAYNDANNIIVTSDRIEQ